MVKTAAQSVLRGEIFFYEHMPADTVDLFPALVSSFNAAPPTAPAVATPQPFRAPSSAADGSATVGGSASPAAKAHSLTASALLLSPSAPCDDEDPTAAAAAAAAASGPPSAAPSSVSTKGSRDGGVARGLAEGVSSLTLARIKGVTFSHLITNRSLTPGRLVLLLRALQRLHTSAGDPATLRPVDSVDLGANYLPKLRKRYAAHRDYYGRLSMDSPSMYSRIEEELSSYESEARWQHANVIHGDPVFSNVLLTEDGRIFLLDMRGELGAHLTLQGDLTYDLSKVYQSLLGYDFIILSQPLLERDAELLEELRHTFRAFVREHYPTVRLSDIVKITASHYFGIVPLHVNRDHQAAYIQTASALLSSLPHSALGSGQGSAELA